MPAPTTTPAARTAPRCPMCGTSLTWEWHQGSAHEYGGMIVHEADWHVAVCPACDWREDD